MRSCKPLVVLCSWDSRSRGSAAVVFGRSVKVSGCASVVPRRLGCSWSSCCCCWLTVIWLSRTVATAAVTMKTMMAMASWPIQDLVQLAVTCFGFYIVCSVFIILT